MKWQMVHLQFEIGLNVTLMIDILINISWVFLTQLFNFGSFFVNFRNEFFDDICEELIWFLRALVNFLNSQCFHKFFHFFILRYFNGLVSFVTNDEYNWGKLPCPHVWTILIYLVVNGLIRVQRLVILLRAFDLSKPRLDELCQSLISRLA